MIGQTISHYKILEKLGEGGMGVVYKAQDIKLDRTVALKFLPSHLSTSEKDKTRFLQEAKAAAALNHPNICTIYGIEENDDVFIVMEYIDGKTLKDLKTQSLEINRALSWAIQIGDALREAHSKGIVHRDIKCENIMVASDGRIKVMDFGLAKLKDELGLSRTVSTMGTTAYMSPEQHQSFDVDHRTDIWSFGVVLYELLTNRLPFRGEHEAALMYSIANEEPQSIEKFRPDVSEPIRSVIKKALEKSPDQRYQTIQDVLDDLHKAVKHMQAKIQKEKKSIAVLPFENISPDKENEYFGEGLTEEIIANLSKLQMVRVISRTTLARYEWTDKGTKQIGVDLGVEYLLRGSVRKHGSDLRITTQLIDVNDDAYLWAETYKGTIDDIFDIQEAVASKIVKALKVQLTPSEKRTLKQRSTENTEAYQLYLQGRFFWNKRNREALQIAVQYFEKAIKEDSQYAQAWAGLADAYNLMSEYGEGSRKENYSKAKAAVEKAIELDDQLSEAHTSLASLMMLDEWDWIKAEKEFNLAIELNPNYATAHHWYSEWLKYMGYLDEALREVSLAAELDPLSPAIQKDKGMMLYYARRYDEALEPARKTLELDSNFASVHRLLSLAYQEKKMFAEAITENNLWENMTGNHAEGKVWLSYIYAMQGKRAEALNIIEKLSPSELTNGNLFRGVGFVYTALGENEQAFQWLEKAFEVRADSLCSLKVDPKADHLRSDKRFTILLKKIGLER